MAWTYAAFEEQATDALRLAMARSYLTELRQALQPNVAADGMSRDNTLINTEIAMVTKRIDELRNSPELRTGGIVSRGRFVGP